MIAIGIRQLVFISLCCVLVSISNCSQCENSNLNNLVISTVTHEDSNNFDMKILNGCSLSRYWTPRSDLMLGRNCIIPERVFEGEDIIRRPIRFDYVKIGPTKAESVADKLEVVSIDLEYEARVAKSNLSKTSFTLFPGESQEIYIDYECVDMDMSKKVSQPWTSIKFTINFSDKQKISFEYTKICTATYKESFDFSHLIIVISVFLVIYLSVKDFLKSNIETVVVEKFTEIKNLENLFIISLCVLLILLFSDYVGYYTTLSGISSLLIGVFSMALIFEALLKHFNLLVNLEATTFDVSFVGSFTLFFLVCIGGGTAIYLLWLSTKFWIFNDLIAFSIALVSIRIIKFTSVKFLLFIYCFTFFYQLLWALKNSKYFGEDYKLANNSPISLPIKLVCPEFRTTPFSACTSMAVADIILPGLYLMFLKKFDTEKDVKGSVYFQSGIIGLVAGLGVNLIVYYIYSLPTSAFLYTGPFIVFISLIIAIQRQEVEEFLGGFKSYSYETMQKEETLAKIMGHTDLNQYDPVKLSANVEMNELDKR